MKQIFLQKGKAVVHNVSLPLLTDNVVLVRVMHSFISAGTESAALHVNEESLLQKIIKNPVKSGTRFLGALAAHGIQGTRALIEGKHLGELSKIGYSCAGEIIAIGKNITQFRVGDLVACAGSGIANHADVVAVPENLMVRVRKKDVLKQTSITTIGAIALQGIRRANLSLGETVCVVGLGLLGQLTAQIARLQGCNVIGIDIMQDRLDIARASGADYVLHPEYDDIQKKINFITNHHGVDATIITAASSSGDLIQQAMEITRKKGRVVLVGDVKLDFNRSPFYAKEIDFLISCSYGPGRYDRLYEEKGIDYPYGYVRWTENRNMQCIVDLIEKKKLCVDHLISEEFPVDNAEKAYETLKKKTALGMIISYGSSPISFEKKLEQKSISLESYVAPEKEMVRTALIGAGGFARVKLLPLIKKIQHVKLDAIIDKEESSAINCARQYSAKKSGNDYQKIVFDSELDAVVIATPHKDHTKQALSFLRAGKAVFLEKPAAVTQEDFQNLRTLLTSKQKTLFCVDFNRSWASYNQTIKRHVAKRSTPLVVHYRMNAGFIPQDHWVQEKEQGGRIIGEACHIFELFCFLTDAKPVSVMVEAMRPQKGKNLSSTDNVTVHLRFDDGSCCTLLYTSLGDTTLAKERMEIFFDGKSFVMDDYKELRGYGVVCTKKSLVQDKGHEALMKAFFDKAKNFDGSVPIPYSRILLATEISMIVDQLARDGGGRKEFV